MNQIDLRLTKLVRARRTRVKLQIDLYNLTNAATVLGYNQVYNPNSTAWLTPTSVLGARVAKAGATVEF